MKDAGVVVVDIAGRSVDENISDYFRPGTTSFGSR